MTRDLFFVLVCYGSSHRERALASVRRCLDRLFPRGSPTGVVVDNALDGEIELELDGATTCIGGDNRWREFSGWDRGLSWLEAAYAPPPDSVLLLANDTIQRDEWREYLEGIGRAPVREMITRGGLLGRTDAYPREVQLFGLPVQRWLCTALMLSTRAVLERLRPLQLSFSDDEVFAAQPEELFRQPSPLSPAYQGYLRSWLLDEPGELQTRWHSAAALSAANVTALRGKVRAILCEHHLSARARALGVPWIDGR